MTEVALQYRPEPLRERDKYRGRRRVPTPPRSRYAAVVTTAIVGAGVVAFAAGAGMPDVKADANALNGIDFSTGSGDSDRATAADKVSRGVERSNGMNTSIADAPDAWILPVTDYQWTSPFGMRWGKLHAGVDLAVPEGTPVGAVHGGKVILAKWYGGYGYCVIIDHGNGFQTVYGHNSKLLVHEGQDVSTGDIVALSGNTGHSFGPHVHLEIHVNGVPVDPVPWFKKHGVDIRLHIVGAY